LPSTVLNPCINQIERIQTLKSTNRFLIENVKVNPDELQD